MWVGIGVGAIGRVGVGFDLLVDLPLNIMFGDGVICRGGGLGVVRGNVEGLLGVGSAISK